MCIYTLHTSLSTFSDGLGRAGTFIAIWSLIEQMKAEGQIDVVSIIKSIRTQRPGAVPHLVGACTSRPKHYLLQAIIII